MLRECKSMSFIKSYGDMWFFISHWIRGADSKICSIRRAISHLHFVIQRESLLSFSYSHISDTFHESISHINDQYIFFIYWYRPLPKMQTRNVACSPQIVRTLWIKTRVLKMQTSSSLSMFVLMIRIVYRSGVSMIRIVSNRPNDIEP